MKPIWISTEKAAELLGISSDTSAASSLFGSTNGKENGRKVVKINVRSLPKEACDRYIAGCLPELSSVTRPKEDLDLLSRAYDRSCGRSKKTMTSGRSSCSSAKASRAQRNSVVSWTSGTRPTPK